MKEKKQIKERIIKSAVNYGVSKTKIKYMKSIMSLMSLPMLQQLEIELKKGGFISYGKI